MSDNTYKQNTYSRDLISWHKKGRVGHEDENAKQVYEQMEEVTFVQRPYNIILNGKRHESSNIGIIRIEGNNESEIGITKGRYNLTQPLEYCQIFDKSVNKPVETLGFLGENAEKLFITWILPAINVHGDIVKAFGLLSAGFDGKYGEKLHRVYERVVCENTLSLAISDAEQSKDGFAGKVYSGKHNSSMHERDLAAWMSYITRQAEEYTAIHESLFCKMQETKIDKSLAYSLFCKVYPLKNELGAFYPDEIRAEKEEGINDYNAKQTDSRDFALELFAGKGIEIDSTLWGGFNAVTEAENHYKKSKKDTTYSILLGNRQTIMENALKVFEGAIVR